MGGGDAVLYMEVREFFTVNILKLFGLSDFSILKNYWLVFVSYINIFCIKDQNGENLKTFNSFKNNTKPTVC